MIIELERMQGAIELYNSQTQLYASDMRAAYTTETMHQASKAVSSAASNVVSLMSTAVKSYILPAEASSSQQIKQVKLVKLVNPFG